MKVQLKLFGHFRKYLPPHAEKLSVAMEINEEVSILELLRSLGIKEGEPMAIIRNHRACDANQILREGDVIAVFPPMSGG